MLSNTKKCTKVFLYLLILLSMSSLVFADDNSLPSFGGIGGIIGIIMLYQIGKSDGEAAIETGKTKGVAGWLLFFIGLMAITGFGVILRIISDLLQMSIYGYSAFMYFSFIFTEFLDLISAVALIVAAYYLWKIKPGAKWFAIGALLIEIFTIGVNWVVVTDETYLALSFLTIIRDVIIIIYLLISRRVRNTYAKEVKLPKKSPNSNGTVIGWLIVQTIALIIILVIFQADAWAQTEQYYNDKPCIEYCNQYPQYDTYYYNYDGGNGKYECQCLKNGRLLSKTYFVYD